MYELIHYSLYPELPNGAIKPELAQNLANAIDLDFDAYWSTEENCWIAFDTNDEHGSDIRIDDKMIDSFRKFVLQFDLDNDYEN
jgi:hypothetical protein